MWRITIPILPNSMNVRERQSFWARKKELEEITAAIHQCKLDGRIPEAEGRRFAKVTIHKGLRSRKKDDPANRDSRAKSVLDALVRLDLLVDDDDAHLEWLGVHEGVRLRDKCTVIDLGEYPEIDLGEYPNEAA